MSRSSRDGAGDRLAPLQSVVTDSAHENTRIASGQSRPSLDNPQPDSIEFQPFAQGGDGHSDAHGSRNGSTEGTSNPRAPASLLVHDNDGDADSREVQLNTACEQLNLQRRILRRLKAWHDWDENRHKSLRNFLLSKVGYPRRPPRPGNEELRRLAFYYFPPRSKLKVIICDYGDHQFDRFEVELGVIKSVWLSKPPWATTLEDLFQYESPKRSQNIGSNRSQLTYSCEILSLREKQYLQDQVDIFNILGDNFMFNVGFDTDTGPGLLHNGLSLDFYFRANTRRSRGFWHLARSDLPWQLTEGIHSDLDQVHMYQIPEFENQMLSQHREYSGGVLVRDLLQCFHRNDGFLLTMSASEGVNYLNQDLAWALTTPPRSGIYDSNHHYLEYVRRQWSGDTAKATGTTDWQTPDVEFLLTYIMTKLQRTPTHSRQGRPIPDIQSAYVPIVSELKRRRGAQFKRHESVKLVREYVSCMNEISQIYEISEQKIIYLEEIHKRWRLHERQMIANNTMKPEREGDMSRIIEATISYIKDNHKHLPRLLSDLKSSLDVLFQLRTIEQNELAIIAESNNKAILVFTVVTIVFLPLSFFTSYFGMNLRGITDTDRTERYFWAVCGSVTVFVVTLTVIFGFKNRLHAWAWENRRFAKR